MPHQLITRLGLQHLPTRPISSCRFMGKSNSLPAPTRCCRRLGNCDPSECRVPIPPAARRVPPSTQPLRLVHATASVCRLRLRQSASRGLVHLPESLPARCLVGVCPTAGWQPVHLTLKAAPMCRSSVSPFAGCPGSVYQLTSGTRSFLDIELEGAPDLSLGARCRCRHRCC